MSTFSTNENGKKYINILDLPESIFRKIFNYFDHGELFFTIKSVCRLLETYVELYIELGGVFILSPRSPETPIEVLYIFKKKSKPVSSCSKLMPPLPHPINRDQADDVHKKEPIHYLRTFGAMIKGNLIIGVYFRFKNKCRYFFWTFDEDKLEWLPIELDGKQNQLDLYEPWPDVSEYLPMASCAFEDTILILGHVEVVMPNKCYPYRNYNNIQTFVFESSSHMKDGSEEKSTNNSTKNECCKEDYLISKYKTSSLCIGSGNDDEVNRLTGSNMMQMDDNNFLLFGVISDRIRNTFIPALYKLSKAYYENDAQEEQKMGPHHIRSDKWNIMHERLHNAININKRPILFKLNNKIFIGGGAQQWIQGLNLRLHQIDLQDSSCTDTSYALPYHVDSSDGNALTDEQETFALISREYLGRTLIFTEKDGFHELPNINYDEVWENYHLTEREKERLPKMPLLRVK